LQTDYFLFAGRLDITKGLHIILNAISNVNESIKILVAGDGPCKSEIQNTSKIKYEGQLTRIDLIKKIHEAIAVIFPSIWYETFGLSIIEAFASGKPVIASNLGAMAELIEDGRTGLLFEPGNSDDLADKINWANEHKEEMRQMGINARKEYEEKYTAERKYKNINGYLREGN
jgi:glycosyltransferase involved in cell wall biosynthesis